MSHDSISMVRASLRFVFRHVASYIGDHILRMHTRFFSYPIPGTNEKGMQTVADEVRHRVPSLTQHTDLV